MSGFDNGTLGNGVFFQAKQFGSILRGFGPPVPQAGVIGDLYIDVQTWFLYNKRSAATGDEVDPWGHYLFQVPLAYRTTLKWFNSYAPGNDVGVTGDYCLLWAGFSNYGMQPSIYGPKLAPGWPENGNGPNVLIAGGGGAGILLAQAGVPILAAPGSPILVTFGATTTTIPTGLVDEGPPLADSGSTQLIVVGLSDEYILAVPVTSNAGDPITQQGLQSGPAAVAVTINPLYTAEDQHAI